MKDDEEVTLGWMVEKGSPGRVMRQDHQEEM